MSPTTSAVCAQLLKATVTYRDHFTGQEDQMPDFGIPYSDHGARHYSPALHRWMTPDPLSEKYYGLSPYNYCGCDPVNKIDSYGRDTVLVADQSSRPLDNGTKGTSYTASVVVIQQGEVKGQYRGSSYPNSKSNSDNSTDYNTVKAGEHRFNNKDGHNKGTKKGLNLIDGNGNRRTQAYDKDGVDTIAEYVNVHSGATDNGNYKSRGSTACITIHPDDADSFFSHFDWSTSATTGESQGVIVISRTQTLQELINKYTIR